ncbi:MAG: sugar kinase [Liquorilactobacillus nagelii]|uniref:sugar kinase n=1 Tax=Liquorilactobacillus nagelii TaxID=82688 RepID=UPI0039EA95BA
MPEFLSIGEPLVVFAAENEDQPLAKAETFKKYVAGAELNVCLGLSKLQHVVHYVSRLGRDPFGDFIVTSIQKNHIKTDYVSSTDKYKTGFYFKNKVSTGDPDTFYFRKDSAASHFDAAKISKIDFSNLKVIHLTGIFAALSPENMKALLEIENFANNRQIMITFDPNLRPALWKNQSTMIRTTNRLAANATIVMPGVNEAEILMGSRDPKTIAEFYLKGKKTQAVVIKMGAKGAYFQDVKGNSGFVPGFKVTEVIDTVGAGDGFAVGFIHGILNDYSLKKSIGIANAIGAMAVTSEGDNDGYPDSKQLNEFLKANQ